MFCGSSMPADMKSGSLIWWSAGLSEMRGAHSKHNLSRVFQQYIFSVIDILVGISSETRGGKDKALWCFGEDITPALQRVPRTSGVGSLPLPEGTRWWETVLFSSLPALPPLQNTTLCPGSAGSVFGVSVASRTFCLPTFPLPSAPLVPGLGFCVFVAAPSPHPVLLCRCGGEADADRMSSRDLTGAPFNFVCGHGYLIFI